ncbi:hypothetical protein HDU86_004398 [Geranomyces michiganensis]|nr:hypothetical protein HDU86_004398 [Geranomyces michiganensis]
MFTPGKTFCKVIQRRDRGSEGGAAEAAASLNLAANDPSQNPSDTAVGDSSIFYVSCFWEDISASARSSVTAFKVEITDGNGVWSKRVTLAEFRALRPEGITEDEYMASTRAALSGLKIYKGQRMQLLVTTFTEYEAEISWFFVLDQGLNFALGKLSLTSVSVHEARGTWMRWIDELITKRTETLERSVELEETVADLRAQKAALVTELEEWVTTRREAVERTIYKKFKDVLNAKKARIRNLLKANAALAAEALEAQRALELSVPAPGPSQVHPQILSVEHMIEDAAAAESGSDSPGRKKRKRDINDDDDDDADDDAATSEPAKRHAVLGNVGAAGAPQAAGRPAPRAPEQQHQDGANHYNDDDDDSSDDGRPPALFGAMRLKVPLGRRKPTPTGTGTTTPVPRDPRAASPPAPVSRRPSSSAVGNNNKAPPVRKGSNLSNEGSAESLLRNLE